METCGLTFFYYLCATYLDEAIVEEEVDKPTFDSLHIDVVITHAF
jgi:hypothetical protein